MPDNRRNMTSKIGLILSFIGMAGLVLSILSLLPLNLYNIYTTIITSYKLLLLNKDWLSPGAKLYLFFLCGSCFSSLFEILATLLACTRHRASQDEHTKNNQSQPTQPPQTKSWFIRIICFTLCLQILFSLIGTHIIYKAEIDIPKELQDNTLLSCTILWINYISLLTFSFILLFASFCILMGAKHNEHEETRPLMIV